MANSFEKRLLGQIGLLTGMGVALSAAGTAEAIPVCTIFPCEFTVESNPDPVSTSQESQSSDPESTTVTFNQFDPTLGTLTEIDFNLTSTLLGSISVSASSEGTARGRTDWSADYTLTLPGNIVFSDNQSTYVSCAEGSSCSASLSPSYDVTWFDQVTLQSILDQYTGLGTLDAVFDLNLMLSLTDDGDPPSSASGTGSAIWDPPANGLTVTYRYTPKATVPEPGTLALLGIGAMAGFGFSRKRLKSDG